MKRERESDKRSIQEAATPSRKAKGLFFIALLKTLLQSELSELSEKPESPKRHVKYFMHT